MYSDGKVYATFNNVTIGIDAIIFVEIHELTDANEKILAYKGNSPVFTVHEGENNEEIELKKVDGQNQEQKQEFTVTFDAAGGAFDDGSETQQITVEEGTPATIPEPQPTYQGYIFDFWATRQDAGGLSQYEFSQPVTGNLTLYAKWRAPNQVASVQFNPATGPVDTGTTVTLSCDTTNATIYYTTDGSDPATSSNRYTSTPITITTQTTIKAYAVKSGMTDSTVTEMTYSLNQYTVQFVLDGGSFTDGKATSLTVTSGETVTLTDYVPTKSGFNFGGWYFDTGLQSGADSSVTPNKDNTTSGTLTLYAQWRAPNQVASVQFNPATGPVDTGTTVTLSCDTTNATIYYTTDGSDPATSSNRYTSTPITITTQTTIKAYAVKSGMTDSSVTEMIYSLNQYTVQFVLNRGSFTESGKETSLSVQSGTEVVLKNYQVKRAGYTFGGWYYDATFNTPVDNSGIVTPTQANITLYAKWEAVNNSITSFADLKSAITSASETIHVAGSFEISETLTISSATTIIADAPTTFTRATELTGALFTNSADFTLQGSENAIITIDGNNIEASAPAIKSTANLTVTYCNFENNTNKATDGGAIFVDTTETMNFSASNCNFTNNKVTGAIKAGGAVAIEGASSSSSFTNCTFTSNVADASDPNEEAYGGAVYINGDTSAYSEKWHEFTSCAFTSNSCVASKNYGGAMYFMRGSLSLNNVTMQNNKWGTETANANSDIFADTSAVNLKLAGLVQIDSLLMKTLPKNLAIGDSFQTSSKIQIFIDASSPTSLFKVLSYDEIGINNTGTISLSPDQIACFTSIEDSSGKQYTLNSNGTITAK